jgi:hypothetical protein
LSAVELIIDNGMRLHFGLDVGSLATYLPYRLRNKDKVLLQMLKDLNWRVEFFEKDDESDESLYKTHVTLEAVNADEDLVRALKALLKIRGLRREDVERLKSLPLKEACKELIIKFFIS